VPDGDWLGLWEGYNVLQIYEKKSKVNTFRCIISYFSIIAKITGSAGRLSALTSGFGTVRRSWLYRAAPGKMTEPLFPSCITFRINGAVPKFEESNEKILDRYSAV
jgi:hypothetical protein